MMHRASEGAGTAESFGVLCPEGAAAELIRTELEKVLGSTIFSDSERLSTFLRFAVEKTIEGQGDRLKEYLLGVEVFRKGESFDPRLDAIVRVQAANLRTRLQSYYETEGAGDELLIEVPKGGYIPVFRKRELGAPAHRKGNGRVYGRPPAPWPRTKSASIAVLPFLNLSSDPENEYFADGLTEDVINELARIEGLRVVSRTSVFEFKGRAEDVRKIGAHFDVRMVLEGSVRKAGERLRITAQLISAADGYHLWSGTFERAAEDVFAIQQEIARSIARALRCKLSQAAGPGRRPVRVPAGA